MKYTFTAEIDGALREIYASASRRQFTLKMRRLSEDTGISRAMLHYRASRKLDLRFVSKCMWTKMEDVYLEENAGLIPVRRLAKMLGRSQESVSCRIQRLNLEARFRRGYSREELAERLGADEKTVRFWQERGWLRLQNSRYSPETVGKFLRDHIEEISLKRVDEEWLKRRLLECFEMNSGKRIELEAA